MVNQDTVNLALLIESVQEQYRLDDVSYDLFSELQNLDIQDIQRSTTTEIPDGAKSGGAITIGELLIAMLPAAVPALIAFLQTWVLRREGRTVKVKRQEGNRSIEVEYNPNLISSSEIEGLSERLAKTLLDGQ